MTQSPFSQVGLVGPSHTLDFEKYENRARINLKKGKI